MKSENQAQSSQEIGEPRLGNTVKFPERLGVILPVFDEAETVAETLRRVLAQACVEEVLVVDDGSTDGTTAVLEKCSGLDGRLHVLRHLRNTGKGSAIKTALGSVRSSVVVIQDADLEYDPADYTVMLKPLSNGRADVVYGSRFLRGGVVTTRCHRLINWTLTACANLVTGLQLTDVHTCLKMFPTELLRCLELVEQRFGFCAEVTAKLARINGLRLVEVPVSYHPRRRREGKKVGAGDGLRAIYCFIRYSFWSPGLACETWMTRQHELIGP